MGTRKRYNLTKRKTKKKKSRKRKTRKKKTTKKLFLRKKNKKQFHISGRDLKRNTSKMSYDIFGKREIIDIMQYRAIQALDNLTKLQQLRKQPPTEQMPDFIVYTPSHSEEEESEEESETPPDIDQTIPAMRRGARADGSGATSNDGTATEDASLLPPWELHERVAPGLPVRDPGVRERALRDLSGGSGGGLLSRVRASRSDEHSRVHRW